MHVSFPADLSFNSSTMTYAIIYSCCGDLHPKDATKGCLRADSLQLFLLTLFDERHEQSGVGNRNATFRLSLPLAFAALLLISLNLHLNCSCFMTIVFAPCSSLSRRFHFPSVVFSMRKSFLIVGRDGNACLRSL